MTSQGKKLLGGVAGAMVLIFVALFVVSGSKGTGARRAVEPLPERAATQEARVEEGVDEGGAEAVRALPNVTLSRRLQETAMSKFVSNRLGEAIHLWELSVYLNDRNGLSRRRLAEVQEQLDRVVQEIVALGNHDFKYLRYARAIYHWEKVLNLVHDKDSPVYQKTVKKIELAKRNLQR